MPIFFEPTAKEREPSLIVAGTAQLLVSSGKPKTIIWHPPRNLGSKRKHHTAFAGAPKISGISVFPQESEEIEECQSRESISKGSKKGK